MSAACCSGESPASSAAARPPWARKLALSDSGLREIRQTSAPARRPQRGPEPGGSGADHRHVVAVVAGSTLLAGTGAGTVTRRGASTCATRSPSSTTRGRIRRTRSGSGRSRRPSSARAGTGSRWSRRRPATRRAARAGALAPPTSMRSRAISAARRGAWSTPTRSPAPAPTTPRCGPRAARRTRSSSLIGGEERFRLLRPAAPGPPRRADAAMGFCLFNNVAVGSRPRARRARDRAGDDRRLGRAPRQRHPGGLLRLRPGPLREHPPEPALSREPALPRRPGRGRGRATRSTCRSQPGAGPDEFLSLVQTVIVPIAAAVRARPARRLGRLRRPPRRPARPVHARRGCLRRDGRQPARLRRRAPASASSSASRAATRCRRSPTRSSATIGAFRGSAAPRAAPPQAASAHRSRLLDRWPQLA